MFHYNDWNVVLLGLVLERATAMPVSEFTCLASSGHPGRPIHVEMEDRAGLAGYRAARAGPCPGSLPVPALLELW